MDSAKPRLEVMASDPGTQLTIWPGAGCWASACSQACRGASSRCPGQSGAATGLGSGRPAQGQQHQWSWPGGSRGELDFDGAHRSGETQSWALEGQRCLLPP